MRTLSTRTLLLVLLVPAAVVLVAGMVWGASTLRADAKADDWPVAERTVDVVPGDGTWASPESVDRSDPDAVAKAVARISAEHDTVTDRTMTAAVLRAGDLISEEVRAVQVEPERGSFTESWLAAAEVDGYSTPLVQSTPQHVEHEHEEALVDPVTGEELHPYTFTVTPNWVARSGDPVEGEPRTVYLSVAERDGKWTVVEYGYQSA